MQPIEFKVEDTNRKIKYEYIPVDAVFNVPIFDNDGTLLGRAWLTQNIENSDNGTDLKEKIILADIIVYDPEDRGKGVGNQLMGWLTTSGAFQQILTGLSTKAGRELCLKWGFKYREHKGSKFLIWEAENATDDQRKKDQESNDQDIRQQEKS